jgi:hypothetical protein
MQPDFDFQFGRRHHLRGYRGLVALGLVLITLVMIFTPAKVTTLVAIDSLWSALSRLLGT